MTASEKTVCTTERAKKKKKRKSKKQKIVLDKWAAALYNNVRPPERIPRMKLEG